MYKTYRTRVFDIYLSKKDQRCSQEAIEAALAHITSHTRLIRTVHNESTGHIILSVKTNLRIMRLLENKMPKCVHFGYEKQEKKNSRVQEEVVPPRRHVF